jgi:hypothetical protein
MREGAICECDLDGEAADRVRDFRCVDRASARLRPRSTFATNRDTSRSESLRP